MFFDSFLSLIFGSYSPAMAIFLFALVILFITQLPYKFLVDHEKVKELKERQKELSKKMKEAQKDDRIDKATEYMNEAMKLNSRIMSHTIKPLIISLAIFFLVIPWLRASYGDILVPLENNTGSFIFLGESYNITIAGNNLTIINTASGNMTTLSIAKKQKFAGREFNIMLRDHKLRMQQVVYYLPITLPLIGNDIGWLLFYFLVSMPIMLVLKKIMGIAI
ncbi:MAG: DUF106 domain-containing protein [Candidatus Aenigmarchaeota archaeon]|nr:DUF106 domain-containing protein [Candidatus Aenigmarchaeota archaeon]